LRKNSIKVAGSKSRGKAGKKWEEKDNGCYLNKAKHGEGLKLVCRFYFKFKENRLLMSRGLIIDHHDHFTFSRQQGAVFVVAVPREVEDYH